MVDVEVKKLEDEINEAFLIEKLRMVRQSVYDHTDKLEEYRHELVSLLPWLGPYIAERSDEGSALQVVKCAVPIMTMEGGDSLRTRVEDRMEPHKGGTTT